MSGVSYMLVHVGSNRLAEWYTGRLGASEARASSSGGEQMAGAQAATVELTAAERQELTRLVDARSTAQQVALRARIVLVAAEGRSNAAVGRVLGISREAVRLWRDRWLALQAAPVSERSVAERLADAPRPGAPARIGAAQVCASSALACEAPMKAGRPISQWTGREIAEELVAHGIVEQISPRHASYLLKKGACNHTASGIG